MAKRMMRLIIVMLILATVFSGCCLSHDWQDATCTTVKKCLKCGKTEGSVMGHIAGEKEIIQEAVLGEIGISIVKCKKCGEELSREEIKKEIYKDGYFVLSKQEFADALNNIVKEYNSNYKAYMADDYIDFIGNGKVFTLVNFAKDGSMIYTKANSEFEADMMFAVLTGENDSMAMKVVIECATSLSDDTVSKIVLEVQKKGQYTYDNYYFVTGKIENYDALFIKPNK